MTVPVLLHEIIEAHARARPEDLAWQFAGVGRTWSQAHERIERIAGNLRALGLTPGQRVAVFGENSGDVAELFLALGRAGLVAVPVNPRSVKSEVAYVCADVNASCLAVTAALAPRLLADDENEAPKVPLWVGIGAGHGCPLDFDDLLCDVPKGVDMSLATNPEAMRAIKYTSGTTGRPKGCISTHAQFLESVSVYLRTVPFLPGDRALLALPMTAGVGMYLLAAYVMAGISTFIQSRFAANEFLDSVAQDRISRFYGMPTMLASLTHAQVAVPRDLSSLRLAGYGGSPAAAHLVRHASEVLGCGFYQTFGASEAGGFITCLHPQEHALIASSGAGTLGAFGEVVPCGSEVEGVELRIVGVDGQDVKAGVAGEMWVRTTSLMSGYWNCPEETTQTIRSGWLVSGDMVVRGSEGFISVVDRKRDMIISGGYNVYSSEVESVLQRHPSVGEVAVVGVPDPYWGESVVAFICPLAGRESSEAEVFAFAEQHLASYKRPRAVYFALALPKTTTGKIRKAELREQALQLWQARNAAAAGTSQSELQPIQTPFEETFK